MPQSPEPPARQRARLVRRRITAATLATFVAAWLAVAALGKGGATSTAATNGSTATGTSSQADDGSSAGSTQSSDGSSSDGSSSGADSGSSQGSRQGGPLTTSQS